MKIYHSALFFGLSLCSFVGNAFAVPVINFNDSVRHNNYLKLNGNKIDSTFNGVGISYAGDLSNPAFSTGRITLTDILVDQAFATGAVETLASPASGGVFNLYNGNTNLLQANLGAAQLTYSYTGTSGPQNDPVYVLRYDTSSLHVTGGSLAGVFAMGGFNGYLDLVFDNTAQGYLEFAGGSLYGASDSCNHNCGQIPEPTTIALLGMSGIAFLRKRKAA